MCSGDLANEYQTTEHSNSADPVLIKRTVNLENTTSRYKTTKKHHSLKLMMKEPQLIF